MSSPNFRAAKTDSQGAVVYEYGPEYIIGSLIFANRPFITSLECQAALSSRITVSSFH